MHKFINNYDIIGQNVGQIQQTSGTKSETTGTIIVPVVNMLKYALQRLGVDRIDSCNFELCSQDRLATISKYLSVSFSVFLVTLGPEMPAQKKLGNHHWVEVNYLTV